MKSFKTKIKRKIIFLLGFSLLLSATFLNMFPLIKVDNISEKDGNQDHRELHGAYFNNSMTPIAIDGDATGPGAHNWSWAASQPWCTGSGTQNDPYVIANLTIDGMGTNICIKIKDSNAFFVIRNCTLFNATNAWGIDLTNTQNGKIFKNRIFSNYNGIRLIESSNNEIIENDCFSNTVFGMILVLSESNDILRNNCSSNGNSGIYVDYYSKYNKILSNNCSANFYYGIELSDMSDKNEISGNICSLNGQYGIRLDTSNNTVLRNTCFSNGVVGILFYTSNYSEISENHCYMNRYGIYIHNSVYNEISDNICEVNDFGIFLDSTEYSNIVENNLSLNDYGIYFYYSNNNEISENDLNFNDFGIYLESSNNNNKLYQNYFIDNEIHARDNGINNVWDNGIIGNYWDNYTGSDTDLDGIGDDPYSVSGTGGGVDHYPIWFFYNLKPIFIDGDATGVGAHNWTWASYQPWCDGSGTWNDPYVIKDVIIDGQGTDNCIEIRNSNVPFVIRNSTLHNASPLNYHGAIHFDHVNNSLILENNCSDNGHIGIILYDSCYNNTIQGNIIHNNDGSGISLRYSPQNMITENWIANSTGVFGVYLLQSHYGTFTNNIVQGSSAGIRIHATEHTTLLSNTFEWNQVGISLRHGHYSIISQNTIHHSWNHGIRLDTTAFCEIYDNFIYNTTYDGIRLIDNSRYNEICSNEIRQSYHYGVNIVDTNVHNNTFYRNYFIDNDENAWDDGSDDYWDNDIIGNYWDDYTGSDTDLDGIGDDPYSISGSGGGIDNYPIWFFYVLNPIFIDGDATGVGAHNWTWAANQPWCTGSGTQNDPYVIANLTIDGMGSTYCIDIKRSSEYFLIENCTLFNATNGWGIHLSHTEYGKISRNKLFSNDRGIELLYSYDTEISENDCFLNNWFGIDLRWSEDNDIFDNNCSSNGYSGIRLCQTSSYNKIVRNNCSDNSIFGIELYGGNCDHNEILDNNCNSNGRSGIRLLASDDNQISGNNCNSNDDYGIHLESSSNDNTVSGNNCSSNENDGINIDSSNNDMISDNLCSLNGYYGIHLISSSKNTLAWNILYSNYRGIYVSSSNNITVLGNNCSLNLADGIRLDASSDNNTLSGNNCNLNEWHGIILHSSNENLVLENNCSSNLYGIYLYSSNNTISENNCFLNNYSGIYLVTSKNNTINRNHCFLNENNGIRLYYSSNNNIISENNCSFNKNDGINIYYSCKNNTISGNNCNLNEWGGIGLDTLSNNNTVLLNYCSMNQENGIYLYQSSANNITSNNCSSNNRGIYLRNAANNNKILKNILLSNSDGIYSDSSIDNKISKNQLSFNVHNGILLVSSNNTMIFDNDCYLNGWVGIQGYYSSNNTILNNNCSANSYGIRFYSSKNNTISENVISSNVNVGIFFEHSGPNNVITENTVFNSSTAIYLYQTNDTSIFMNDLIDNTVQALDNGFNNQWDNGTIGNYWSDYWEMYSGVDLDDDGIGDIPYNITGSAGSQDRYPIWDDGPGENHPPTWDQMPTNQTLEFGITFLYDINASDTSGINAYWINDTSNFQIDLAGIITNITTLFAGEYWLEVSVNDTYGNILSTTIKITIEPASPPSWDPLPMDQVDEFGTNFAYDVNALDLSGIDSYWINESTYFQIDDNGLITHLIEIPVGVYWLKISVNDTLGNLNSTVIKITIQDTTPPDWVYILEDQNLEYGDSLSCDVSAWDASGIDAYWVNDTSNFQINSNGLITNCSLLTVQVYWLEIHVNDTIGLITSSIINITVEDTTIPNWLESPSNQIIEFGIPFNYEVNASDLAGIDHYWINDTTNFQIDVNGVITNVGTLSSGTYSIEIRAYDPHDNFCSATIEVTVESEPVSPSSGIPGFDIFLLLIITGILGVYLMIQITKKRRST